MRRDQNPWPAPALAPAHGAGGALSWSEPPTAPTPVIGPATTPPEPAAAARPGLDAVGQLVKVAFLVRLVALLAATLGLVGSRLTPGMLIAVLLLGGTSFAGLSQPRVLAEVIRHPALAMADVLMVLAVCWALGVESPLSLGMLSTALLIGVLFPLRALAPLSASLVAGYVGAVLLDVHHGGRLGFFLAVGMPVTLISLVGVGQSVRRVQQAQRRAEHALAEMLQATAVADERARLAREVHDSLAKSLQGLAFGAAALPTWVERDGDRARAEATALARGASQAVQEARTLLTRMRSDEPARPFSEVLGDVVRSWGGQHGHSVVLDAEDVSGLDADARYELLAAAREALENVRRHAPGAAVAVRLRTWQDSVLVSIADGGPGFDPGRQREREAAGHFGLRGMSERMASVGGRAQVESRPGQGTTVWLSVPQTDTNLLSRR